MSVLVEEMQLSTRLLMHSRVMAIEVPFLIYSVKNSPSRKALRGSVTLLYAASVNALKKSALIISYSSSGRMSSA
jgi:hypothetical protein